MRLSALGLQQRLLAGADASGHFVAGTFEVAGDQIGHRLVILDHKNSFARHTKQTFTTRSWLAVGIARSERLLPRRLPSQSSVDSPPRRENVASAIDANSMNHGSGSARKMVSRPRQVNVTDCACNAWFGRISAARWAS